MAGVFERTFYPIDPHEAWVSRARIVVALASLLLCVGVADVVQYRRSVLVYSTGLPATGQTYWIVLEKRWEWLPGEFQVHEEISRSKYDKLKNDSIARERTRWYACRSPQRFDGRYMNWYIPYCQERLREVLRERHLEAIVSSVGRNLWVDGSAHALECCDTVLAELLWVVEDE